MSVSPRSSHGEARVKSVLLLALVIGVRGDHVPCCSMKITVDLFYRETNPRKQPLSFENSDLLSFEEQIGFNFGTTEK
jgi:hypothetical protein